MPVWKPALTQLIFKDKATSQPGITIMFVCICNAITDRQIQETVAAGASSLSDLQAQLGVATCCGCCSDLAASYLTAAGAQTQNTITAGIKVSA